MNYDCDLVSVVLQAECTVTAIVVLTRSCRRADGNIKGGGWSIGRDSANEARLFG